MPGNPPSEVLQVREQILAASVQLFAQRGVAGVSLREIASAVDLHNSTLLHYFGSKQELAVRVFEAVAERHRESLAPLSDTPPPDLETAISILSEFGRSLSAQPDEARILMRTFFHLEPAILYGEPMKPERPDGGGRLIAPLETWLARARKSRTIPVRCRPDAAWQLLSLIFCTALSPPNTNTAEAFRRMTAGARAILSVPEPRTR